MAEPKRRTSSTRRDTRRNSHWKLEMPGLVKCPNCGQAVLSHRMCKSCGYYNGREVVKVAAEEK